MKSVAITEFIRILPFTYTPFIQWLQIWSFYGIRMYTLQQTSIWYPPWGRKTGLGELKLSVNCFHQWWSQNAESMLEKLSSEMNICLFVCFLNQLIDHYSVDYKMCCNPVIWLVSTVQMLALFKENYCPWILSNQTNVCAFCILRRDAVDVKPGTTGHLF